MWHSRYHRTSYKRYVQQHTKAVVSQDGETDAFEILAGVLKGDTLSPYIFILILDYVMRVTIGNDEDFWAYHVHCHTQKKAGDILQK